MCLRDGRDTAVCEDILSISDCSINTYLVSTTVSTIHGRRKTTSDDVAGCTRKYRYVMGGV